MACLFLLPTFGGCGILYQLLVLPKTEALPFPASWEGTEESLFSLSLFLLRHFQVWTWGKGKWGWIPFLLAPAQPVPSLDVGKGKWGSLFSLSPLRYFQVWMWGTGKWRWMPFLLIPGSCSAIPRFGNWVKVNGDGSLFARSLTSHSQVWMWGKGLECTGSSFAPRSHNQWCDVCIRIPLPLSWLLVNKLHIFLEEVIFCHCTFKCQAPGEESSREFKVSQALRKKYR